MEKQYNISSSKRGNLYKAIYDELMDIRIDVMKYMKNNSSPKWNDIDNIISDSKIAEKALDVFIKNNKL